MHGSVNQANGLEIEGRRGKGTWQDQADEGVRGDERAGRGQA